MQGALHLGPGECGLRVVAAKEKVVQTGYDGGEDVVHAWENRYIEVVGVVGAVVEEADIARYTRVIDETNVPGVALELVEDGDFGGVQVETL